jgi:hypothetical protein
MKKIYPAVLVVLCSISLHAQLILSKAFNEPVPGDLSNETTHDTVTTVPKKTGTNQVWNFSTLIMTSTTNIDNFMQPAAAPQSSLFPGATLADNDGNGMYSFYKSVSSPSVQLQLLGFAQSNNTLQFSNPMSLFQYPFAFSDAFSDVFSGTFNNPPGAGTMSGSVTAQANGSGTLILPAGSFQNILQFSSQVSYDYHFTTPSVFNMKVVNKNFAYFHSSQKFPLLTINYSYDTLGNLLGFEARVNTSLAVSLEESTVNSGVSLYPNPAREQVMINANGTHETLELRIEDLNGRELCKMNVQPSATGAAAMPVHDLPPGIYILKVRSGELNHVQRLIKE